MRRRFALIHCKSYSSVVTFSFSSSSHWYKLSLSFLPLKDLLMPLEKYHSNPWQQCSKKETRLDSFEIPTRRQIRVATFHVWFPCSFAKARQCCLDSPTEAMQKDSSSSIFPNIWEEYTVLSSGIFSLSIRKYGTADRTAHKKKKNATQLQKPVSTKGRNLILWHIFAPFYSNSVAPSSISPRSKKRNPITGDLTWQIGCAGRRQWCPNIYSGTGDSRSSRESSPPKSEKTINLCRSKNFCVPSFFGRSFLW